MLIATTLAFSDVRHDAAGAKAVNVKQDEAHEDQEDRLQSLEQWRAAEEVHRSSLTVKVDENATKLDKVLEQVQAIKEALAARPR